MNIKNRFETYNQNIITYYHYFFEFIINDLFHSKMIINFCGYTLKHNFLKIKVRLFH